MSFWLMPDYMFEKFDDITPEFLKSVGIRALVIDIDNTLAPYEQAEPDERIKDWFSTLAAAGISASLISNNSPERVNLFNSTLGLDAYPDAHKPGGKYIKSAMTKMGSTRMDTAVLGDQLLTDALAGKRLGLRALIVPPIKDKTNLFFKSKRLIEKPFIKAYKKKHSNKG